jgi:glycerol-3-phosphate O-acyltransferase/dihydroxyacetone phosphate acyltransferase
MCGAQIFVANQFIAGIAIMALGALAQNTNVTVVPVGMNYFHAHKFRSRAVVEFGDPVPISPELLHNFKNGKKRESIGQLLNGMHQALSAVTMTAPDFETLMVRNFPFIFFPYISYSHQ